MEAKRVLTKALKLEKCFRQYDTGGTAALEVQVKFKNVWGQSMANHFLSKYDNADSLIWALDGENLQLFIDKF